MAASLCQSFARMHVSPRPAFGFSTSVRGVSVTASRQAGSIARAAVVVQASKGSVLKRERQTEKRHEYNLVWKRAVKYHSKQVLKTVDTLMKNAAEVKSETELSELQQCLNQAYQTIDKAVSKGVLHKNTGSRRKARLAGARQRLLIAAGLYTPQ